MTPLVGVAGLVGAPLAALVLMVAPAGAVGPGCQAGNIEVTTNTDAAIRAAFLTANGQNGPVTICIDSGVGMITLGGTELTYNNTGHITPGLTLEGNGATISGNNASRVIHYVPGTGSFTLDNVTITGGNASGPGGGIFSGSAVNLTKATVSDNTAASSGGGISSNSFTMTKSTVSGNTAATSGGGVSTGAVTATNSTVSGNTGNHGGAFSAGSVTLVYSTVVQNNAKDTISAGSLTSFASVVAQTKPAGGNNCSVGGTTSKGFNFSDDADATVSCMFGDPTDKVGAANNPLLGPLANNGGPTQTMLPQDGPSPLIDGVAAARCQDDGASGITTDQRGLPRPDTASPNCDIGAVEVKPVAAAPTAPTAIVVTPKFTG